MPRFDASAVSEFMFQFNYHRPWTPAELSGDDSVVEPHPDLDESDDEGEAGGDACKASPAPRWRGKLTS